MTLEEFRNLARRTRIHTEPELHKLSIVNASLGIAGESGEVVELIKKHHFHGKNIDREALIKELGDLMFYIDWLADGFNVELSEVLEKNVDKLKKRYPDGFVTGGGNR